MKHLLRLLFCYSLILLVSGCASLLRDSTSKEDSGKVIVTDLDDTPVLEASTQISPELLKEELDLIREHILTIHPQPFARWSKAEFETHIRQLKKQLNYPLSRGEFFLRVAPLLANMHDVHSYVNLPKDQFGDFRRRGEKLFPLAVILHQKKIFVASDLSAEPMVPNGAEIISINQAPVSYLLDKMRSLTVNETPTGQNRRIQMDFTWLLSAMGYARDTYRVQYLWQDQPFELELAGLKLPKSLSNGESPVSFYGYSKLTPNTSLFWLNDFNENPEVFEAYLDEKFTQMHEQGIKNLILDLRYNSGGLSENLKALLSRLTHKPIHWAERGVIKISESLKKNHLTKTRQRREDKYSWGLQWLPFEWTDSLQHSIWWSEPGEVINLELNAIEPNSSKNLSGVWVLTNGYCYSACSFFVASVNHHQLGKTLGEKPGSLAKFQFAYPVNIELPHSGLTLTLPTMRLDFTKTNLPDLIMPQEQIRRTQEDIASRRDPVLNRALRDAESVNKQKF
ncbi:S41 family peptidase [Aliikangiella coralliicola]|uniref:Tail specific protease domain-containing protein n=1 Tax=Aliikangiella coralliicola TaxID=2592383 RepID=A0A545UEE2_9GAMM|nr:S41 family peptidase [Aliikangiella coralliicola]TQV87842.1 hypothetical protein FLL46_10710 [Aliikangiella coralliicola]